MNTVSVKVNAYGHGEIRLNGELLEGVRRFEIAGGVGELTTVNLTLIAEVEAEADTTAQVP